MNKVQSCAHLLSNKADCEAAMRRALAAYPISAKQHLSKPAGRRPWMGAAACCVELGSTEEEVRIAWNFYMTADAQASANAIADVLIVAWERGGA